MANPEHVAVLKQSMEQWNTLRDAQRALVPDLSGVDLRYAYLRQG
jgi:hypothetical protein